jgi:hypothetical protein
MSAEDNSSLREEIEGEFEEKEIGAEKLIETLMESFLRSSSDYGAIADIETDIDYIYSLVKRYIEERKMDVYALKIDDRILLSRTNEGFDDLYEVIKRHSELQIKKDMIEIWDDAENQILHLLVIPVRKHFPIKYTSPKKKIETIKKISLMTWTF